jgi:hypothetical protein
MMAAILGSGGAGMYRTLRTTREVITKRLWRPLDYTDYSDINFNPVETYSS